MQCWHFILLSGDSPSQWEIEETVRFKDLYDQDKDGKLNREEQLRWVAPNSYGSAREEVGLICSNVCPDCVSIRDESKTEFFRFNSWANCVFGSPCRIIYHFCRWWYGSVFTDFFSLFCTRVINRLFTFSRRWTTMQTGRSQRQKFWKIKKHSWTVKWQTLADSCMYHMMNYNNTFYVLVYRRVSSFVSMEVLCCLFPVFYFDISHM